MGKTPDEDDVEPVEDDEKEAETEVESDDSDDDAEDEPDEAFADLPVVDVSADDAGLKAQFKELETAEKSVLKGEKNAETIKVVKELRARRQQIADLLIERQAAADELAADIEALENEEAPKLPEKVKVAAADIVRNRKAQSVENLTPSTNEELPKATMLAAAGAASVVAPGAPISDSDIGKAAQQVLSSKGKVKAYLASVPAFEADEYLSTGNPVEINDRLIREAVQEHQAKRRGDKPAVTAAICDPLDPIREIPECADASSPVADAFPSRALGRGGFAFTQGVGIAGVVAGVALWDEESQAAVDPDDPDTHKPCLEVSCPEVETIRAQFATACLVFDNTTELSNPERVNDLQRTATAMRIRAMEASLLTTIDTESVAQNGAIPGFAPASDNGAIPTLIEAVHKAIAQSSYPNRRGDVQRTLILQTEFFAAAAIDQAARSFTDPYTDQDILAWLNDYFGNYGVNVIKTLDSNVGNVADGRYVSLSLGIQIPDSTQIRIVTTDDAIFGRTGEIFSGVERSPELRRQNRAQWFQEEMFLLARHGCGPWISFAMELCASGARTGFTEPVVCAPALS